MIRRFDRASLREHLELRAMQETEAARLAASRRTAADLQHLHELLAARGERPVEGDITGFVDRDIAFHLAIVQAARNTALEELYRYFLAKAETRTHVVLVEQGVPEPNLRAHARILTAIANGDPEEAATAARDVVIPLVEKLTMLLGA
jgi:DNA-binding FadR family transcriptional regulator